MELKRIDVWSLTKLLTVIYAVFGLIIGAIFSLFSKFAGGLGGNNYFGNASVIGMPIIYAVIGAVSGSLTAVTYNLVARWIGGVKLDLKK